MSGRDLRISADRRDGDSALRGIGYGLFVSRNKVLKLRRRRARDPLSGKRLAEFRNSRMRRIRFESLVAHSTLKNRSSIPVLPYGALKREVLGEKYELSLVFIGDRYSRSLNKKYRGADKPANVLSFPLEKQSGELFLNPAEARRGAPRFGMSEDAFLGFLFIHGLLHLSGYRHGSTMDAKEQALKKKSLFE